MSSNAGVDAVSDGWAAAIADLSAVPSRSWTTPFLSLLPVDGMAVSTLGSVLPSETVFASDAVAAHLDELQFDLGEGPCWDAVSKRLPVLEADLVGSGGSAWPALSRVVIGDGVQSLFAFPMLLGPMAIGAVDLYSTRPGTLNRSQVKEMQAVAAALTRLVFQRVVDGAGDESDSEGARPHSRRIIHQATGAVIAQLGLSAGDAHLVIQGRAFADGRSMQEVADDIMQGRLLFTADQDGSEDPR